MVEAPRVALAPRSVLGPMSDTEDLEFTVRLIPGAVADEIMEQIQRPNLLTSLGFDPNRPRAPLTLRQKVRLRLSSWRWRVHDHLFPDCQQSDW